MSGAVKFVSPTFFRQRRQRRGNNVVPTNARTAKPCGPGRRCYGQAFAEAAFASTGAVSANFAKAREARRNSAPGRARHKPSNHCAGKAVCWASPVCRCASLLRHLRTADIRVPAGTRPSLRPLGSEGGVTKQNSGEMRCGAAKVCLRFEIHLGELRCSPLLRHCEERSDEAIQSLSAE
jgi:hypothetical protein